MSTKKNTSSKRSSSGRIRHLAKKKLVLEEKATNKELVESPGSYIKEWIDSEYTGFDPERYRQEGSIDQTQSFDEDSVILVVPYSEKADLEIERLANTLGFESKGVICFDDTRDIKAKNYFGDGFVDKIKAELLKQRARAVVVDAPLSPGQVRSIEKFLGVPVIDRQGIILSIFDKNASSKLAKQQVELARLKYLAPRLAGLWMGLSRQRGAKGGLGGRGGGEKQLELDRRTLSKRIHLLQQRLAKAETAWKVQSKRRSRLPRVALVGYTNAGKSTLMRQLTQYNVKIEDQLFCTLDTTVKALQPLTNPKILVSDTVGFVKNLPHDLVEAFKSTLREAVESKLILHVVDVSSAFCLEQIHVTEKVLSEIGASEVPKILVLNKIDELKKQSLWQQKTVAWKIRKMSHYLDKIWISAHQGSGVEDLKRVIVSQCEAVQPAWATESDK